MATELTEEEMRRALFGPDDVPASAHMPHTNEDLPIVIQRPQEFAKRKALKLSTPKLKVTLRVGNEFEGATEIFVHEADTLSTLQAEVEATKAARKKFKYIEVVSVTSN
ncbi:hypothetical protein YA0002_24455 [Pseudomonas cichorii]|uniref:hypothetical protein n=1 Tax=Pseudomonas cichorii TaxID=36746 RepID=UPI0018E62931|nr:hypothetical protein [Pseudomonas cichorii]MBI6855920.1 hypothetical protein [Pseudomonas cichorii]